MNKQKVLVTGANGFIGSNLVIRLSEVSDIEILHFVRGDTIDMLTTLVESADAVVHLAGNRPNDVADFARNNVDLTSALCDAIQNTGRNIPLIFVSSMQATHDNPYGQSKLAAEQVIESFVSKTDNSAVIYRLVGVFGKFCKPNYNSVVATFCYNLARGLPIQISDPDFVLDLAYIDDVVNELSERVGIGLTHALYSTYISNLPIEKFVYDLTPHSDERGIFVEMLKTQDSGQFSFFTIAPGITRGSHYHHSKTEKFLLVSGSARMRFRNLVTKEIVDFTLSSKKPRVVDTIPGWVHDITNIGHSDAIVMLWANEVFDQQNPDCIPCEV